MLNVSCCLVKERDFLLEIFKQLISSNLFFSTKGKGSTLKKVVLNRGRTSIIILKRNLGTIVGAFNILYECSILMDLMKVNHFQLYVGKQVFLQ